MKTFSNIVILLALAIVGFFAWQAYRGPGPGLGGGGPAYDGPGAPGGGPGGRGEVRPPWRPGACAQCGGTRQVNCSSCAGRGKVDRVDRVPCKQCGGTGRYQSRVGPSAGPCPFCSAKGYTEKTNTVTCSACGGSGKVTCQACATGR